jgi:hypothetical protein
MIVNRDFWNSRARFLIAIVRVTRPNQMRILFDIRGRNTSSATSRRTVPRKIRMTITKCVERSEKSNKYDGQIKNWRI